MIIYINNIKYAIKTKDEEPNNIKKEYISIIPLDNNSKNNYEKLFLEKCKIEISKYNKILLFSKTDDSIIILNHEGTIKNMSYYQKGYLIKFKDNTLLIRLKSLTLEKIIDEINKNDYTIINDLYKLFKVKIEDCIIKLGIFEVKGDLISEKKEKCIEISPITKKKMRRKLLNGEKRYGNNQIENDLLIEQLFDERVNNIIEYSDNKSEVACCKII